MAAEERPNAFTSSYLPVTYKRMWDSQRVTRRSPQTYSTVDASALLALATTCYTPITLCLCSYWSAKHFNPSLSPRPRCQPKMINQRQVSNPKATPGASCLHTLPTILHACRLKYRTCEDFQKGSSFWGSGEWVRKCSNVSSSRCHFKSSRQYSIILYFINIKTTFFHLVHIIK